MRRYRRRATGRVTLLLMAASAAALCGAPAAEAAAGNPLKPIVITPSSGCGLLTAYTAGTGLPAWSSPAPSLRRGSVHAGVQPGERTRRQSTLSQSMRCRDRGQRAAAAWSASGVPEGARIGYRITAPPGITIYKVVYDIAQLQNIANGHGWIGLTYWNGGTAQVLPHGTASRRGCLWPAETPTYWGIELRCVEVRMHVARGNPSSAVHGVRSRGAGSEHHPDCRPCQLMEPGRTGPVDLERARQRLVASRGWGGFVGRL